MALITGSKFRRDTQWVKKCIILELKLPQLLNKFIMSDWKTSRDCHEIRKLYTESNMKTNSSFEFSQTIPSSEFHAFHFNTNSIVESPKEQLANSVIYIKDDEVNNNSSFSLKPVVTAQQINEFLVIVDMIRFFANQNLERLNYIRKKIVTVDRLADSVAEKQYKVKSQKIYFEKRLEELENRKLRMANFRKKRSRTITEESQRLEYQYKMMLRNHRIKGMNKSKASQSKSYVFIQESQQEKVDHKAKRKRIYVPIITPQHMPTFVPQHSYQALPQFVHHYPMQNNSPNPQIIQSYKVSSQLTKPKQPVLLSQLGQALTMKLKVQDKNDYEQAPNIDYFDKSLNSQSRNSKERGGDKKIQTPKDFVRKSSSSIKWKKDDNEDKELVQIIQNSIKQIKTQQSEQERQVKQGKNRQVKAYTKQQLDSISPIRHDPFVIERPNRNSDSEINITIESDQKRNSKSFESKDSIDKKKSSKKSDKARIDQSNIKIDMMDMSISKNSASSKSDSSKHAPNRYLPSLNQPFHEIQQESEDLKVTPIDNKLKNSVEKELKSPNSKNQKKSKQAEGKITSSSAPKQYQQDDILKSIRLETESRISRKMYLEKMAANKLEQQEGDDILDGITLLRESKASREKGLSMKSSIARMNDVVDEDSHRELESQSEIFSKIENGQLTMEQLNSSMRQATKSKIIKNRNSYSQSSEFMKRGYTEPVKGQLTSIPSAEFEEEEDELSVVKR